LPHQHIQFGTGTWDPMLSVFAVRGGRTYGLSIAAAAKFPFYENSHGYQAGNRYSLVVSGARNLTAGWSANAGLNFAREEAETWSGKIEEEGNLGRADLFAQFGAAHAIGGMGSVSWTVQIPIRTWATGEQVDFPAVVTIGWIR